MSAQVIGCATPKDVTVTSLTLWLPVMTTGSCRGWLALIVEVTRQLKGGGWENGSRQGRSRCEADIQRNSLEELLWVFEMIQIADLYQMLRLY
jgi:hypothetical protein